MSSPKTEMAPTRPAGETLTASNPSGVRTRRTVAAAKAVSATDGTFRGGLIRYPDDTAKQQSPPPHSSVWAKRLGLHQASSGEVWRAASIEFVGTLMFVFISISIVAGAGAQGNPPLYIGALHGVLLTLFIFATAAPSGGHLNPTITFATMCTGHTPCFRALLYVIAQCAGAIAASGMADAALPADTTAAIRLGACAVGDHLSTTGALVLEMVFTLILLFVAYGCAFDERQGAIFGPVLAPPMIGLALACLIYVSGSLVPGYTGAGMNFARCLGPEVATGDFHSDLWVFFAGPAITCVAHALLYTAAPPHHKEIFKSGGD